MSPQHRAIPGLTVTPVGDRKVLLLSPAGRSEIIDAALAARLCGDALTRDEAKALRDAGWLVSHDELRSQLLADPSETQVDGGAVAVAMPSISARASLRRRALDSLPAGTDVTLSCDLDRETLAAEIARGADVESALVRHALCDDDSRCDQYGRRAQRAHVAPRW